MAALEQSNYFAVLCSEDELGSESIRTNEISQKPPTSLHQQVIRKKKQEARTDIGAALMRAKPISGYNRVSTREREMRRPKQTLITNSDDTHATQNHQAVSKEYEKELPERKKAPTGAIKKSDDPEQDFGWIKVVGKIKKNDDLIRFIKPAFNKEKATADAKFTNFNGGGKFNARFFRQAEHGGRMKSDHTLSIEDHTQFPALK